MSEIYDAYSRLYCETASAKGYKIHNKFVHIDSLSHMVALRGKNYESEKIRFLLVGRAPNGWRQLDTTNKYAFAKEADRIFNEGTIDWIKWYEDKQALGNASPDPANIYWLSKSPFWNTAERIWRSIPGVSNIANTVFDNWTDHIAWSNLYKVAPLDFGNPTAKMCLNQLSACKDILKAEITAFNPSHVLFVTDYKGWFYDFGDVFDASFTIIGENQYRGKAKNGIFAEAYGTTSTGVKIVVSCRPEGRDSSAFVSDIIEKFQ